MKTGNMPKRNYPTDEITETGIKSSSETMSTNTKNWQVKVLHVYQNCNDSSPFSLGN